MVTVKLVTANDLAHVADVQVLPFQIAPDVLIWGQRFFIPHGEVHNVEQPVYREAFAFMIPWIAQS